MPRYRLTHEAKKDLVQIAEYGDRHFGIAQSDAYREQLKAHFDRLVEKPKLFRPVDHIRPGYRRSVCGVHAIYYRVDGEDIVIVRVLRSQDVNTELS